MDPPLLITLNKSSPKNEVIYRFSTNHRSLRFQVYVKCTDELRCQLMEHTLKINL